MNILFCGDKNIAKGVLIAMLSLSQTQTEPLHIYLLTAGCDLGIKKCEPLTQDFAQKLDSYISKIKPGSGVKLFDISDAFNAMLPTANMGTRFTPCCMLRLYADLVDELPDKLLYLDNDVIVKRDLSKMYYTDMESSEIAGVKDYYGKWFFHSQGILKQDYLNSGVLLLNMKLIRKTGLFRKCRNMCKSTQMFMPDQSALNKLARNKIFLDGKYNEQRKTHPDTAIRHFTTSFRLLPYFHSVSVKPWDVERVHTVLKTHEYDELLNEYLQIKDDFLN